MCFFGSILVRSGPSSRPSLLSLWQPTQLATLNRFLPTSNERPGGNFLHVADQVVVLPFRVAADRLQQFIAQRQRIRGEIRVGIRLILLQIRHDVQRPVHPPPVSGVGADIRINAGLAAALHSSGPASGPAPAGGWRAAPCRTSGTKWRSLASASRAVASASRPISSSEPGCTIAKLCGMLSVFAEAELDRLAGLHDDHLFVVDHPFDHGADRDHADVEVFQTIGNRLRLIGGQLGRERLRQGDRFQCRTRRAEARRNAAEIADEVVDRARALPSGAQCCSGIVRSTLIAAVRCRSAFTSAARSRNFSAS